MHFEFLTPTLLRFYISEEGRVFDITAYISFIFELPYNKRFESLHLDRKTKEEFFNNVTAKISTLIGSELSFLAVKE